ncbi:MAG: (Fe-S)-binding protein, partial [Telluria sp.]
MIAFVWGLARHIVKYRRGRASPVRLDLWAGVRRMLLDLVTHRTLRRRDRLAGAAHMAIFFGFALLFIGTAIITLEYDILKPLFGLVFWKGNFFLLFSLTLDLAGLAVLGGIIVMMVRRMVLRLPKLRYLRSYAGETQLRPAAASWQREDWLFLCALLLIILTGFVQEGSRHAMEQPAWAAWEPVGAAAGMLLAQLGLNQANVGALRAVNWWFHGLAALCFIVALPWYKAKHIIAAMGALASRDPLALRRLPPEAPEAASAGIGKISDFSWKDMLDFDACTKCGRCHDVCPARAAGYPLSPRDLILDLRLHNDRAQGKPVAHTALIGGVISADTLWSCRTCGACVEICPVGIEHPVKIVQMRRRLVETNNIDPLLKSTLNTIAVSGNSFGEPARKRAAWTRELEFKVKDVRTEAAQFLWFVGDQASFDPRNQKITRTVARIFKAGGVDFGLLHDGEKTAGNDVRRIGEEGLFEALAEHNLKEMAQAQAFKRIVTTDPHTFNTLHNEYPELGQTAPVTHYTELLCDLLESGALKVTRPLGLRVTFHDPCHLGRLNKRYDAPRRVLELIGCEMVEMPRNRDNSFCCGAGGGRFWIPDMPGTKKPSELRIREAAELHRIDVFVTSCPKDLTMFEDARKTAGLESSFAVEDIADLVAKAIELENLSLRDLPSLAERITATVAERVALLVGERIESLLNERIAQAPALPALVVPGNGAN